MWVSPSENIYDTQLENVKQASGFEPGNIVALTYARLANMTDEEIRALAADGICLDEMHRAGAKVWNTGVERLIAAHPNARLLGLTATPVRYLDNQRDMSEELFDGCVADSMTLGEAIARGILPAPKYVVSLYTYNMDGELHKYRDRIRRSSAASREKAEKYLEKLRRALEKAVGLDAVFAKHLTRGKYIAFCANVEHMGEMLKKAPQWFDGVDEQPHIYSVWADSPSAKADYAAFRADDKWHVAGQMGLRTEKGLSEGDTSGREKGEAGRHRHALGKREYASLVRQPGGGGPLSENVERRADCARKRGVRVRHKAGPLGGAAISHIQPESNEARAAQAVGKNAAEQLTDRHGLNVYKEIECTSGENKAG